MGVLRSLTITPLGTLPADVSSIKKWVEAHGGTYTPSLHPATTHLIVSKDAYKSAKTQPILQQAQARGVHIVTYDWLEDSLQRRRKLAEKRYSWAVLVKEKRDRKELKRLGKVADGKKFVEGCEMIRRLTGSGTSNVRGAGRKPRASKSFFFGTPSVPDIPFVSAAEELKRRKAARAAADEDEDEGDGGDDSAPVFPDVSESASEVEHQSDKESDEETVEPVKSRSPSVHPPTPPKKPSLTPPIPTSVASTAPSPPTVQEAKKPQLKDLYHYYLDNTGFEYKITLLRHNFAANRFAKYQLSILESHTLPHEYCTLVQYTPMPPISRELAMARANSGHPVPDIVSPPPVQSAPEPPPTEAARLLALTTPPTPSPTKPHKALIAPMSSPFATALRAFRHAFHDITLLTWEERFDPDRLLQKARARALNIEPFVYSKPALGMPVGLCAQLPGLFQGTIMREVEEDGYHRNTFELPGLDHPVDANAAIGMALRRESIDARRAAELQRVKEEEAAEKSKKLKSAALAKERMKKSANWNQPTSTGLMGRPMATPGVGMSMGHGYGQMLGQRSSREAESVRIAAQMEAQLAKRDRSFTRSRHGFGYEE